MKKITDYIKYLNKLSEKTQPLWGEMTPQHMLEHLTKAVQSSNGELIFDECMNPKEKYPLLNRILLSSKTLPKHFVNTVVGKGLKPLIYNSLEDAKEKLILEINNFYKYFEAQENSKPMNVTFGPLGKEEWIVFHNKHFVHHFTQFGLIGE
ncbi:MAG: hypothetical protein GY936_17335 [Ignavibacteriae bacterium]|nr:hypothetical protein [Ignavibacteriota bacterium]